MSYSIGAIRCNTMSATIEFLDSDTARRAKEIGLTGERMWTTVESRLRAARLYNPDVLSGVYVNLWFSKELIYLEVGYRDWVRHPVFADSHEYSFLADI